MWKFPDQQSGLTDYHSIPTESALDSKLETFVREVLQNANDQGLPNEEPVKVTFEFNVLTKEDELDDFLDSLRWNEGDTPDGLRWHIERAIENEKARDPGLKRFLNLFEENRLLVLTIHDENTTGLRGNETDNDQPYGALVKDFGGTEKPDSSSGGSHGLGKTVLWAFSGISTVLFNSVPDEIPEEDGGTPPRIVGRSLLPAHEHEDEDKTYTNHGWFGRDDPAVISRLGRPPSLWDDDGDASTVAETLRVDRPNETSGTSIGVPGFRIPGESLNPDLDELSEDLRHASAKYFWPAMVRGELEVYIETPTDGCNKVDWSDAPGVRPFVKCYEDLFNVDTSELSGPGTHAKRAVDLTVPRENSEVVDNPHEEVEATVDLLIRALSPRDKTDFDGTDDDLVPNRVARLRGAQMVVDYVGMDSAAKRGTEFAAVLVCGEAQVEPGTEPTDTQKAVEQFLKRSEPTQHDDWQGSDNDYLKKYYTGTIVKEVNALKGGRLEAEIASVVQDDIETGDEVPGMDDVIPVMEGRKGASGDDDDNDGGAVIQWETPPDVWFDDGTWQFYAEGGPAASKHGEWTMNIKLVALDSREHEGEQIDIDSESFAVVTGDASADLSDGTGSLTAGGDVHSVAFEGGSVKLGETAEDVSRSFDLGRTTQTKLKITAEVTEVDE